jgi:hypothetical protein
LQAGFHVDERLAVRLQTRRRSVWIPTDRHLFSPAGTGPCVQVGPGSPIDTRPGSAGTGPFGSDGLTSPSRTGRGCRCLGRGRQRDLEFEVDLEPSADEFLPAQGDTFRNRGVGGE